MAFILPKGIVVNSSQINGSIQSFGDSPVDSADVARMWKVFTTTSRRLRDPTAARLENYWWRIWGSRSRNLDGTTVADLFACISDGQSFVPLSAPVPRDEGSPPLKRIIRQKSSSATLAQHSNHDPVSSTPRTPVIMPPPILKNSKGKKRGSSGPRPTARFVSPQGSPPAPLSPNSHVVIEPPSPDPTKQDKKSSSSGSRKGQGHVVSAGSKKKRPVIVRRKSSQSSGEAVAKTSADEGELLAEGTLRGKGKAPAKSKFQENFSPEPERSRRRDEAQRHATQNKLLARREEHMPALGEPSPSTLRNIGNSQTTRDEAHLTPEELEELELQRMLLADANSQLQEQRLEPGQSINREGYQSSHGSDRTITQHDIKGKGVIKTLPLVPSATTNPASTMTAATRQLDVGCDGTDENVDATTRRPDKGKGEEPAVPKDNMFAKRPVQPSRSAASLPESLARSKSQLTLLLEKDRARNGKGHPEDEKGATE